MPQPGQMTEDANFLRIMREYSSRHPYDEDDVCPMGRVRALLAIIDRLLAAQRATASELLRLRERLAAAEKAVEAARIAMHGADRALGQASRFTRGICDAMNGDGRFTLDPKLVVVMDRTAELGAKDARVFARALAAYDAIAKEGAPRV